MMSFPTFAVLGPGAVGGFLGCVLRDASTDVTLISRPPSSEVLARNGLELTSGVFGTMKHDFEVVTILTKPPDVLLVATKSRSLRVALESVNCQPRLVVPFLNGLGHMDVIREVFPSETVAGAIRIEVDAATTGKIVHRGRLHEIELTADNPRLADLLAAVIETFKCARLNVVVGTSEGDVLWAKLVRLVPLSATVTAADCSLGEVLADARWRGLLAAALAETARVARIEGARITARQVWKELLGLHPSIGSSMQRDARRGKQLELDETVGTVVRRAKVHGVACPTLCWLEREIRQQVEARRLQRQESAQGDMRGRRTDAVPAS